MALASKQSLHGRSWCICPKVPTSWKPRLLGWTCKHRIWPCLKIVSDSQVIVLKEGILRLDFPWKLWSLWCPDAFCGMDLQSNASQCSLALGSMCPIGTSGCQGLGTSVALQCYMNVCKNWMIVCQVCKGSGGIKRNGAQRFRGAKTFRSWGTIRSSLSCQWNSYQCFMSYSVRVWL